MKKPLSFLPCLGAGAASCLGVWFLIGPMGGAFGFCLDAGPIALFCLAAAVVGTLIARLYQRLNYLEEKAAFLQQRLDKLEQQSNQL